MEKVFISYKEDNDEIVSGYFEIIDFNDNGFLVFKTSKNILRIPVERVLKIKEEMKD